jgi:cytochrome c oxidase assembly protein Cox11
LEVALSKQEVVLQPGEVFEIQLKIRNKTKQPITTRIGHLVEPRDNADYLDFVQCGFLLPVTIPAEKEQEYSGTYMLRGSLPEGVRQFNLTYDFRILN